MHVHVHHRLPGRRAVIDADVVSVRPQLRVQYRPHALQHRQHRALLLQAHLPERYSMRAPSQAVATEAKVLYVAITRAMERLHMTHHASSVFVDRLRAALRAGEVAPPIETGFGVL
jgi:hypothetical protein